MPTKAELELQNKGLQEYTEELHGQIEALNKRATALQSKVDEFDGVVTALERERDDLVEAIEAGSGRGPCIVVGVIVAAITAAVASLA